jgi:hypothetical protein
MKLAKITIICRSFQMFHFKNPKQSISKHSTMLLARQAASKFPLYSPFAHLLHSHHRWAASSLMKISVVFYSSFIFALFFDAHCCRTMFDHGKPQWTVALQNVQVILRCRLERF